MATQKSYKGTDKLKKMQEIYNKATPAGKTVLDRQRAKRNIANTANTMMRNLQSDNRKKVSSLQKIGAKKQKYTW